MTPSFHDLRVILGDGDSVAALQRYYERGWDRILRTLALGIARPGAQRARLLLSQLRAILATLDPRKDSFVRHWVREWIRRSFLAGEQTAMGEIKGSPLRAPSRETVDTVANVIGTVETKLSGAVAQMAAMLSGTVLMVHGAILADPDLRAGMVDGILRTAQGREVTNDLQEVVLKGANPRTTGRLIRNGIPRPVVQAVERANAGTIAVGRASVNVVSYATTVGQDGMVDANAAASVLVTRRNEVDHVYIEREQKKNICPFCLEVQFNVFYVGPEAVDPAGFPRKDALPPGPKWHPHCAHAVIPWPLAQHTEAEIAAALAKAKAIPSWVYGPDVWKHFGNYGVAFPQGVLQPRKLA